MIGRLLFRGPHSSLPPDGQEPDSTPFHGGLPFLFLLLLSFCRCDRMVIRTSDGTSSIQLAGGRREVVVPEMDIYGRIEANLSLAQGTASVVLAPPLRGVGESAKKEPGADPDAYPTSLEE